jgi:hypothetical protein
MYVFVLVTAPPALRAWMEAGLGGSHLTPVGEGSIGEIVTRGMRRWVVDVHEA